MRKRKFILILILLVLLLVLCVWIVALLFGSLQLRFQGADSTRPTSTMPVLRTIATNTLTPAPIFPTFTSVVTAKATNTSILIPAFPTITLPLTAKPTNTPIPATPTPLPTDTPLPANTPTNTPIPTPTDTPLPPPTPTNTPSSTTYALRFYGTGTGDIDRVKIPVTTGSTSLPVNIGAEDFTLEFWLRFNPGENTSGACTEGEDTWISGNIIFDRDIFGSPDYGDFGVSLYGGQIAFGVHNGSSGYTICGSTTLAANTWHHIAITRSTGGAMNIFVNGNLDRTYNGPAGNISYNAGRTTSWPNDPFLVIGAEKHDYDPSTYPSFSGWIDEVRISNVIRYTGSFATPAAPFTPDANTLGLYHFDEGSGTTVLDASGASGGPSHGQRNVGGPNNGPVYDAVTKQF